MKTLLLEMTFHGFSGSTDREPGLKGLNIPSRRQCPFEVVLVFPAISFGRCLLLM